MAASNQAECPNISSGDELPPPEPAHPTDLTAKCHCGRVNVEIPSLPTKINECRCSICYRYGAEWAYYPQDDVNVVVNHASRSASKGTSQAAQKVPQSAKEANEGDKGLKHYVRDDSDGLLGFYFCGNCGCLTHWALTDQGLVWMEEQRKIKGADAPWKKTGVNSRMLPLNLLEGVEKRTGPFCDGKLSDWN